VASRLPPTRREKLLNLKKREELKDAISEKVKHKFASGGGASVSSGTLRQEIGEYANLKDPSANNLGRLERRLEHAAKGEGVSQVSAYSGGPLAASSVSPSVPPGSTLSASRSAPALAAGSAAVLNGSGGKQYSWSKLDDYASFLHEQDCIRQHLGVKVLQKKMKMDLDQQVALKKKHQDIEKLEDDRYHHNSMIELERWKEMEKLREQERHNKILREKEDRDKQLEFERKLKAEESQKKKDDEASLVNKIVTEMENEQRKFERKKEQQRKKLRKVFEENTVDQARRAEENKAAKAKEMQTIKDYARALDEQEANSQAELQARMDRQNELLAKLQANADGLRRNRSDNDEARARAQQDEMDRHFFEAENVKQKRLKQLKLENQAYLLKQMEEKESRKQGERELGDIQAEILQRDTAEYNEVERQKVLRRKQELLEHSKDIKKQMAWKLVQSQPIMTEEEIRINKPLLDLVDRTLDNHPARGQASHHVAQGSGHDDEEGYTDM